MAYEKFDKLVAERTKQWTDELSDYCRIPCETAQLPELKRGADWTADRLRKAGAKVPAKKSVSRKKSSSKKTTSKRKSSGKKKSSSKKK